MRAATRAFDDGILDLEELSRAARGQTSELEAEARRLAWVPLAEVLIVLTRWSTALRSRPRPEDPPATFRVAFLCSDAVSVLLYSLAHNERLQAVLRDPPLFAAEQAAACRPEQAILAEATAVLQLTLRRAVAPLARPLVDVALALDAGATLRQAEAAWELASALKEDWADVARSQATRAVERRIDALTYELQKSGAAAPRRAPLSGRCSVRSFSGDFLAPLCRSTSHCGIEAASAAAASGSAAARRSVRSRLVAVAQLCEAALQAIRRGEARALELEAALGSFGGADALRPATPSTAATGRGSGGSRGSGEDSESECGGSRSSHDAPFGYHPVGICLRRTLADAPTPTLLEHIRYTEGESSEGYKSFGTGVSRESTVASPAELAAAGVSRESTSFPPRGCAGGVASECGVQVLPEHLRVALAQAREALSAEAQRAQERLATQLQQRRTQLVRGLVAHVRVEQERLCSLATTLSKAQASTASGAAAWQAAASVVERINSNLQEVRDLCKRAEAITRCFDPPGSGNGLFDYLSPGQRCRAKWMDGSYYDAAVHRLMPEGYVIVNWLRPIPSESCRESGEALRTVSEHGGDDSLHRIVPQSDVQLHPSCHGLLARGSSAWLFESRQPCDRICVDCDTGQAEWAAVSFGTFLCRGCAEQHKALGIDVSYVREIRGGWGWPDRDLQYMSHSGGNSVFLAALRRYPTLRSASIFERYNSRFAEHYRRQLDATCCGCQAPPRLMDASAAALPMADTSDFLSAAEAAEIVRHLRPTFDAAVQAALDAPSASGRLEPSRWRCSSEGISLHDLHEDAQAIHLL